MCNRDWKFSRDEISRGLCVRSNRDHQRLSCNCLCVAAHRLIAEEQRLAVRPIIDPETLPYSAPAADLACRPGSEDDSGGAVMSGEGGHITVSGRNEREDAIIARLRERFGHCSAERILSGPGLIALHSAMHNIDASHFRRNNDATLTIRCVPQR